MNRAARRRTEQAIEVETEIDLAGKRQEAQARQKEAERTAAREQHRHDSETKQQLRRQDKEQARQHLAALKEMGVDLTAYLTQGGADRVIELRGTGTNPHIHLGQQDTEGSGGCWGPISAKKGGLPGAAGLLKSFVLRDWYIGRAQPSQGCERGSTPLSRSRNHCQSSTSVGGSSGHAGGYRTVPPDGSKPLFCWTANRSPLSWPTSGGLVGGLLRFHTNGTSSPLW